MIEGKDGVNEFKIEGKEMSQFQKQKCDTHRSVTGSWWLECSSWESGLDITEAKTSHEIYTRKRSVMPILSGAINQAL